MIEVLAAALLTSSDPLDKLQRYDDWQNSVMSSVRDQLKDPYSAVFKLAPLNERTFSHFDNGIYCGLVNSKNSYGAYVGYQQFNVMLLMRTADDLGQQPLYSSIFMRFIEINPDGRNQAENTCDKLGYPAADSLRLPDIQFPLSDNR